MARKLEYIKRCEARIMILLMDIESHLKNGEQISRKLNIDYCYVMKLLRAMYTKGWIRTHMYEGLRFFNNTRAAPVEEAKARLIEIDEQTKLKTNDNGQTQESNMASKGNEGDPEQPL